MSGIGPRRRLPLDLSQPCWTWQQVVRSHGYGIVTIDGQEKYVHRLAYQLHVGPIPRGWEIDHVCHSVAAQRGECAGGDDCPHRACWNPAHLEAISGRENSLRGNHALFVVARSKVCTRGHDLTDPEHQSIRADGRIRCRTCQRIGQRARRARAQGGGA